MSDAQTTPRHQAPALQLIRQALGSPKEISRKLDSILDGLAAFIDLETLQERLQRLHNKKIIEEIPTPLQLIVGGIDMLRFWISPAAADYYQRQGINYAFHQLLRFLDDPRSMMNPVGLLNEKDTIIGHMMQVVHADPNYDLQLLEMFDDGIESLIRQLTQMLDGTHPRYQSIMAIVEEPDYHQRLLAYVKDWQSGIRDKSMRRKNVEESPELSNLAQTFGDLTSAMRYFARLPTRPLEAIAHLIWTRPRMD
jgi:hypothetical protein